MGLMASEYLVYGLCILIDTKLDAVLFNSTGPNAKLDDSLNFLETRGTIRATR